MEFEPVKINLRSGLLYLFFFFLPCIFTYPGRIYFHIIGLHTDRPFGWLQLMLLPTVILPLIFIIKRAINRDYQLRSLSFNNVILLVMIVLWFIAGTISFIANQKYSPLVSLFYASEYLSILFIACAFINLKLSLEEYYGIFAVMALGALVALIPGIIAFFLSWGIPSPRMMYYAHSNLMKMHEYMILTFGNTGNTAQFIVLVAPAFLLLTLKANLNYFLKTLLIICLVIMAINLLIVESRISFLILYCFGALLATMKSGKVLLKYFLTSFVFLFVLSQIAPSFYLTVMGAMHQVIAFNAATDNSVSERILAMQEGWKIFHHHFFTGVGPGMSFYYNSYTTAHQFNIQQASELGILGLICSILFCVYVLFRFILLLFRYRTDINFERLILMAGPACYVIFGLFANIGLSIGTTNTWVAIMIAMLTLSGGQLAKTQSLSGMEFSRRHRQFPAYKLK
jgi:hypothetical protein